MAAVDTARFFPQLVFGALIPVGIVMALLGIRKIKVNRGSAPTGQVLDNSVQALERGIIILLSIAVFIALMAPLGFIPTAILYMVFSMLFMSTKDGWKPVIYVVTAVVVAIACSGSSCMLNCRLVFWKECLDNGRLVRRIFRTHVA